MPRSPEPPTASDPATRLLSRRRALALGGGLGLTALLTACSNGATSTPSGADPSTTTEPDASTTSPDTTAGSTGGGDGVVPDCVLTPEQTEGPYHLDVDLDRRDITEGRPGVPLRVEATVVDATTCTRLPGATVELWHADANGDYSGFGGGGRVTTFLRGGQAADTDGVATLETIWPGWYQGRTSHIHVKVHVDGDSVHTGQLYFDEALNDDVATRSPYDERTGRQTTNATDSIYRDGGAASTLAVTPDGDGYVGTIVLGVDASGSAGSSSRT